MMKIRDEVLEYMFEELGGEDVDREEGVAFAAEIDELCFECGDAAFYG